MAKPAALYTTRLGNAYVGSSEDLLTNGLKRSLTGKVQLIFTSPPFALNRKKKYGNLQGRDYIKWLAEYALLFRDLLSPNGSVVLELGNAWDAGQPTMSTLSIEALLAFKKAGHFVLCQEFVSFNPARLPGPAQWVNVERCRVKDAFTRVWWLSTTPNPKADNRRILTQYSDAMRKLLRKGTYNPGVRPSEHRVGETSFLTEHPGAIPPNVLIPPVDTLVDLLPNANTANSGDPYYGYCRDNGVEPHPARMPGGLAEFFIRFLTDQGDLVVDPFAGSNTTGAVAESLNRKWLAIEINPEYLEPSRCRFPNVTR